MLQLFMFIWSETIHSWLPSWIDFTAPGPILFTLHLSPGQYLLPESTVIISSPLSCIPEPCDQLLSIPLSRHLPAPSKFTCSKFIFPCLLPCTGCSNSIELITMVLGTYMPLPSSEALHKSFPLTRMLFSPLSAHWTSFVP
jgi:hypothetical protein